MHPIPVIRRLELPPKESRPSFMKNLTLFIVSHVPNVMSVIPVRIFKIIAITFTLRYVIF